MTPDLASVFAELGISQYLDSFVEQGFDSWDTILDITESDLDALGVKLGHRRKLQRRIANSLGHAPGVSLVPSVRATTEDPKGENQKTSTTAPNGKEVAVVTKRKYRRHPKPDENAPERPPSAYVLFSNKMRDDLKGRNLTFTEIAKLVGENWQSLSPPEKEPYEKQALSSKEKYNQDMAEYKKTPEYRKYCQYLHDFKQKQASQNQAKDASKRLKLQSGASVHHGSSTSATPGSGSGTGSGSESHGGSEAPPSRKQRLGSVTSMPDSHSHFSASAPMPTTSHPHHHHNHHHHPSMDEAIHSPASTHFDRDWERSPTAQSSNSPRSRGRRPPWADSQMNPESSAQKPLPPLSSVFNDSPMNGVTRSSESSSSHSGFMPSNQPPLGPPSLKHEPSTSGSLGSAGSPGFSYSRTPSEASLPIHALLLSGNNGGSYPGYESQILPAYGKQQMITSDQRFPFPPAPLGPGAHGVINGHRSPPALAKYPSTGSTSTEISAPESIPSSRTSISIHEAAQGNNVKTDMSLDGMNALLRAGEIVGRREGEL